MASPRQDLLPSRERELERELEDVRADLEAQNQELQALVEETKRSSLESERLKDEFVANVSHELRTPLTSIIGYVETMLDGEVGAFTEEQEHFLRVVDRNAERLLGLVGDLLFVSNLDGGKLSLELQELDLGRLAGECVEAAQPAAEDKGVELVLDEAPSQTVQGTSRGSAR